MSWQSLPVSGSILTVSWQGCLHFCSSCSDSCLSCSIRFSLDPSICLSSYIFASCSTMLLSNLRISSSMFDDLLI
uniref:Uncharacterized protein n=1 Tax=Anguilla anguilla TaxID=7936 RepID=A0A0E9QHW8_ANGAN